MAVSRTVDGIARRIESTWSIDTAEVPPLVGFSLWLDTDRKRALAKDVNALDILKFRCSGEFRCEDADEWSLEMAVGATVVQQCVRTLESIRSRVDIVAQRLYSPRFEATVVGNNVQIPEEVELEPQSRFIDLMQVTSEALLLELPIYPRKSAGKPGTYAYSTEGTADTAKARYKPFATLARMKLSDPA